MIRTFSILLCVVTIGAVATGCGDDKKSDSSSSTAATPAATTPASGGSGGSSGGAAADPAVKSAVAACKSSIDSNPAVKANIKSDLEGICDKAASGDANAVKQATKEVCTKIVESSGVPSGPALDQAKAACDAAGK
jgi:hypothetical protein